MKSDKAAFYISLLGAIILIFILSSAATSYSQDTAKINRYLDSAQKHSKELNKALPDLASALYLAKKEKDDKLQARVLIAKGHIYQKNNLLQDADSSFAVARNILQNYPKDKEYLLLLKSLAVCNYYLNNNEKVIDYTTEGLNFAKQLNNQMLEGTFNNIFGIAMDNMGNKADAMNYYLKALNIFSNLKATEKIASMEINMGVIYEDQQDEKNALMYYEKALKIGEKIKDTPTIVAAYNNLGNIFANQKDYEKALKYIKKSLDLSLKINDKYSVALDLNNIGDIYENLKDSVLAFRYYSNALDLARKIQDKGTITISLYNLSEYYEFRKEFDLAIKSAKKSLQYAQNGGIISNVLAAMKLLHRLYAKQHNYEKAYQILRSYNAINDSVFSSEKYRQLMIVEERSRINKQNHQMQLVQETKKRVEAYFIIAVLSLLLVVMALYFWAMHRGTKSKELQRQKNFTDALMEESESHVLIIDENGFNTYLSSSYLKDFGRSLNERMGASVFDFVHPDDIPQLKIIMDDLKKGLQKQQQIMFRLLNKTGEYRIMRGVSKKITEGNLSLKGYIVNFWDVTEIQKSQQALKESEEKFRDIFNAFPDIYFKLDHQGIIKEISPSVTKITGYRPDEVIGNPVSKFTQFRVDWESARKIFLKRMKIDDMNMILLTKNKIEIHCSLNAHFFKDQNGAAGFEGTLRDITKRIRTEKDLKKSQRKLKVANDSKEKLLSIIAHDLRGAIGTQKAILNMVTDDIKGFSKKEITSLVLTIKSSVDSTYTIVENLLSWARIMRENIQPRISSNNLYPVVKDAIDVLVEQAKSKGIELIYEGNKAVVASFDPDLMNIVFRNLITNAIKFSDLGNQVKIRVLNVPEGMEISIEDQGVGMSQEEIKSILSDSEKLVSKPGTSKEKGTGLGLIIVREFIAMNHGKLLIESEQGIGTRFIILFPDDAKS